MTTITATHTHTQLEAQASSTQLEAQASSTQLEAQASDTLFSFAKQCDEAQKKPSFAAADEIIYSDDSDDEGNPNPEEFYDDGTLRRQSRRPNPWGYNPVVQDGHLVLQDTREQDGFGNEGGDEFGGFEGQYPDKEDVEFWWGYRD